jgi:hypothetical protein
MHPVHTFPLYFSKFHSNKDSHLRLGLLSSLPSRFSDQHCVCNLISLMRTTCPTNLILLYLITLNNICWIVQFMNFLTSPPPSYIQIRFITCYWYCYSKATEFVCTSSHFLDVSTK